MVSLWILALWACGGSPVVETPPPPPPIEDAPPPVADVLHLTSLASEATLELSPSNVPDDRVIGQTVLRAAFRKLPGKQGVDVYQIALPFHPKLMQEGRGDRGVGSYEAQGFVLTGPQGVVPWSKQDEVGTWGWERRFLQIRVKQGAPAPKPKDYTIALASLAEEEQALNLAGSGLAPSAFAFRRLQTLTQTYEGILLPAPSSVQFEVQAAPGAVLDSQVRMVPSPVFGTGSDGVVVVAEHVGPDGEVVELGRAEVTTKGGGHLRASLDAVAGQTISLRLRTEPGATSAYDYVQLVDPSIYVPTTTPRHVVMIYLDTTRADHLTPYGYTRDTTPALAAFAEHAAIFDQARTVAPWTLPSIRAALSGDQPERWSEREILPETLQRLGFATMASFTNVYLTPTFDMDRGWTEREYELKKPAAKVVDDGIRFLKAHADRDAMVLLQFMDTHIPYEEPQAYRGRWAEEPYDGPSLGVYPLRRVRPKSPNFEHVRDYVTGRYDQALRYVDDELARLFAEMGDHATVVVFADHGEELWDHGSYEHGHTFFDELLRVPLLVRAPGMAPGHRSTPVSLLDVTPTVLEAVGMRPDPALPGMSLLRLAAPDADDQAFVDRPLGFGRPLYDDDGWGVVTHGHKWFSRSGDETVYDLGADPAEKHPVEDGNLQVYRDQLGASLGTTSQRVWKLKFSVPGIPGGLSLRVTHPDGIEDAWLAYEPRDISDTHMPRVEDGALLYDNPDNQRMPQAFYVVPKGDVADLKGLRIQMTHKDRSVDETVAEALPDGAIDRRNTLFTAGPGGFKVLVQPAWVPMDMGMAIPARSGDVTDELRELGYVQ